VHRKNSLKLGVGFFDRTVLKTKGGESFFLGDIVADGDIDGGVYVGMAVGGADGE